MSLRDAKQITEAADLQPVIKELQGLTFSVIAGAAAGTKMDIAAIRKEDTIIAAIVGNDTAVGGMADDALNLTIQETHATGTLTVSGNPTNAQTFVVNGVTYAFKTTPLAMTDVKITLGDNNAMAAAVAAAVNSYENRRLSTGNWNTPAVVATVSTNVVTFTSVVDGPGNGPVVTDTGTTITVSSANPAAVTATCVSVAEDDALTVNGVTFTAKDTPDNSGLQVDVGADDTIMATNFKNAINAYAAAHGTFDIHATSALGVVTISPVAPRAGNIITLTESATNVAVSGSGFLSGGTATGGVKSSTNLTDKHAFVVWFNKN